jgi:sulfhydrogenase subunit beta (sulfur reductase)
MNLIQRDDPTALFRNLHERGYSSVGVGRAAKHMDRTLDTTDIRDLQAHNFRHPRREQVVGGCLTRASCTHLRPLHPGLSDFPPSTAEDTKDLAVDEAERGRRWDSCFGLDHSYIHGGSVRATAQRT